MQIPILIEPLSDRKGYRARLGDPFGLTVEAATSDEALRQLTESLHHRLRSGVRVASIAVPETAAGPAPGGWLPDDALTQEWRQAIQEYRQECDAEDHRRILGEEENNAS